jgi:hypothetical protein
MNKSRHHGFSMLIAIALVSLTGMAVTEITVTLAADVRRTMRLAEDAQLRQLLLAGAEFAVNHPEAGHYDVAAPAEVGGKLSVDVHGDNTVDVEATVPRRRQSERLTLAQENGGWQISEVVLEN